MPDPLLAEIAADMAEVHGEEKRVATIVYTPFATGIPKAVSAVVDVLTTQREGLLEWRTLRVQLQPADAPAPDVRDRFLVDGAVSEVREIPHKELEVVFLALQVKQHQAGGYTTGTTP